MKKILTVLTVVGLVVSFAVAAQAYTVTLISAGAQFEQYCPTCITENFEDTTLIAGLTINEFGGAAGIIAGGAYQNEVDDGDWYGDNVARYQVFNYAPGMTGFGGFFDASYPGGPGSSIKVYIDDDDYLVLTIPSTSSAEFYGFLVQSTTPFYGVRLEDAQLIDFAKETYQIIDLKVCPAAPVPIPAAIWLLGSGLLGLVGLRRKFKK